MYLENLYVVLVLLGPWTFIFVTLAVLMSNIKTPNEIARSKGMSGLSHSDQVVDDDKIVDLAVYTAEMERLATARADAEKPGLACASSAGLGMSASMSGSSISVSDGRDHEH